MSKTTITENDIRLTAYAVGEMDAEEKQQFERLLADSPEAQAEVQAIRQLSENLSTEFERELSAVEGQQPLASVDNVIDAGGDFADHSDSSDKIRRPRFWAFGSIAAGLAAMLMVVAYVNKDRLNYGTNVAADATEGVALEPTEMADTVTERSEAYDSKLREKPAYQLEVAPGGYNDGLNDSRAAAAPVVLKRGMSRPAPFDDKAAGSLDLAQAKEAAPGKKGGNMPGESQSNSGSGRPVAAIPSKDAAPAEHAARFGKAESASGKLDDGAGIRGGSGGAEAPVAASKAEAEGEETKASYALTAPSPGGAVGGVIKPGAAAPMTATPVPPSTSTSPPAPSATPAPSPKMYYGQRGASVGGREEAESAGAAGGNPATAGNRLRGFAGRDGEADARIDLTRAADAVPSDGFKAGSGSRRIVTGRQGGDRHAPLIDNRFKDPLNEALSTFSIDVDTASYAQVRRALLRDGQWPHPNEVRIEELINYFAYDYPAPDWDEVEAGHAAPFAVSLESAAAPWAPKHRLVSVGLKSAELSEKRPAANLVFLLDVSGSMNNADKLPLLQKALRALVPQLRAEDSVTMVAYAGRAGEVLPPTPGNDHETILAAIDALSAGGSTNGAGGITLAYQRAWECFADGGVNRVILATDGDFNVGVSNDDALVKLVEKKAQSDIFLTVLGFGSGNLNDSMMEKITNKGNGNYFYIDGVPEAKKVLVEQMAGTLVTVAKDVKIQVDFNPAKVASYRLIGYANRMLKREDFDNDKVDAGEIGAGHTVTALYEIIPVGVAMDITGQDVEGLKYQKRLKAAADQDLEAKRQQELADRGIEMVESNEMLTVKLRYKQPTATESALLEFPLVDEDLIPGRKAAFKKVSADFQFASAVAAFGMRLRNSQYISKDFSFAAIAELAAGVAEVDDENEARRRKEFVTMVEKAAGNEPSVSDGVKREVQERLKQLR